MPISFITMNRFIEEQAAKDAEYRQLIERNGRRLLSHGRALSDEVLLEGLHTRQFPLDKQQFLTLSQRFDSAEEMAQFVCRENPGIRESDSDWIWIAFTCMWERWQPERTSLEMIDDRMQDGYEAKPRWDSVETCRFWIATWEGIWSLIERRSIQSIKEFDDRYPLTQCLFNWIQDFISELYTAGFSDRSFHQKRLVVLDFLRARLQPGGLLLENSQRETAETYFLLGMPDKGEEFFRQWLHDKPKWGWGWINWSDCYYSGARDGEQNPLKAEQILKQGLSIPGVEDREHMLARLEHIYSETGRTEESQAIRKEIEKLSKTRRMASVSRTVMPNDSSSAFALNAPVREFKTPVESLMKHGVRSAATSPHVGRNDSCPCGSGKKFKRCCGRNKS